PSGRTSSRSRSRRSTTYPNRRHGRALRPKHHHGANGSTSSKTLHKTPTRSPPHDHQSARLHRNLRPSGIGRNHRAPRSLSSPPSRHPTNQSHRQTSRSRPQSLHTSLSTPRHPLPPRHGLNHDRKPRLRRPGLHPRSPPKN